MSTSAFFYGVLLHPQVLQRVIGNNGDHLKVASAVLPNYTRHHVKGCDYPAMAPYTSTNAFFGRELKDEEKSVRGTVVLGLTKEDMRLLDVFEGDEYVRQTVSIFPLAPFSPLLDPTETLISPETPLPQLSDSINVETYVWDGLLERLVPEIWSFDVFVNEKLWRWVGRVGSNNSEYTIVDERRALNGKIKSTHQTPSLEANDLPRFGHTLLSQFCFHKDYVNLNHGSYGSLPRPVLEAVETMSREVESSPDKFMRITYSAQLKTVRERLARFIGAETDQVVMVPNATHGVNTILRNFIWNPEDVIVGATTTYSSISRTLQYIHDLPPYPTLSIMTLTFPISHTAIVEQFRAHLRAIPRKPDQKVVAVIDSIVSNPGCVLPWEKLVAICKEENVWSVVDAAHSIGQVGIDVGKSNPDFLVSNCHKWLFAKRGCAVMYVPHRNQHIIKSTIPTSSSYVSPNDPPSPDDVKTPNFLAQFEWTGTLDMVPYLSINAALDYREQLGGEVRINEYCHDLAVKGGKRLAQLLQTNVMDEELTANMVNVMLPLPIPPSLSTHEQQNLRTRIEGKLLEEWDCFAAVFTHDGKWWTRCSAQVFNELSDFDLVARALNAICAELRNEQVL